MIFGVIIYRYIMFGRGICEKYQSRDEKFPEPNGEGNLVSRLVLAREIFCLSTGIFHKYPSQT